MDSESVAVIIPTYYRNKQLAAAIESVLRQTYDSIEIIVVDDSGEGHARPVGERFEDVRFIERDENEGANAARTVGAEATESAYVQFLDDDDRLFPEKVERQVELLQNRDTCGVAYAGHEFESGHIRRPTPGAEGDVLARALRFELEACRTSSMLIDRDVLSAVLPLADRPGSDDIGIRIELALRTHFAVTSDPLLVSGRSDDHRSRSWGAFHGRRQLLDEYADLYEDFPPAVRRKALAKTWVLAGVLYLEDAQWSPRAIAAFARSDWYTPDEHGKYLGRLLASLAGRPGLAAAHRVWRMDAPRA